VVQGGRSGMLGARGGWLIGLLVHILWADPESPTSGRVFQGGVSGIGVSRDQWGEARL